MENKLSKTCKMTSRDRQAAETKERLMKAAVELFSEQGYTATSVRAINRKAGVADGLLYHYFSGGKKELFHDVVELHVKKVIEEVTLATLKGEYEKMELEEALENHFSTVIHAIDRHADVFRMVCKEEAVRELISNEEIDLLLNNATFQLAGVLEKKIESGELKNFDIEAAGKSLCAMVMSYVFCRVMDLPCPPIAKPETRKPLIDYYVQCWKK